MVSGFGMQCDSRQADGYLILPGNAFEILWGLNVQPVFIISLPGVTNPGLAMMTVWFGALHPGMGS